MNMHHPNMAVTGLDLYLEPNKGTLVWKKMA